MYKGSKTTKMVTLAVMTALLVVCAQITIPIGAIPFSMAFFGVFLVSALLPPPAALACLGVYLFLGLIGIPVFAQFRGGPQVLLGATGGYLVGYFVLAAATSFGVKYLRRFGLQVAAALGGMVGCYLFGTAWYVFISGNPFLAGLAACVFPFVIPDSIKLVCALALARTLKARLGKGRAVQ